MSYKEGCKKGMIRNKTYDWKCHKTYLFISSVVFVSLSFCVLSSSMLNKKQLTKTILGYHQSS